MEELEQSLDQIIQSIKTALVENRIEDAVQVLSTLHYADQADVFNELDEGEQGRLLPHLDISTTADILEELEDRDVLDVVEDFPTERLADVLDEMEPDEAADLLGDLPIEQATLLLQEMEDASEVIPLLGYEDETAGGLMTTSYISLRRTSTTEQAIQFLRKVSPDADVPYYIYVTDRENHLIGVVGLRELIIAPATTTVESIMNPEVHNVKGGTDQEEAARIMMRYDLAMLPVVDDEQRLVGVITHDDILDVLEDEATEDIYRMANVTDIGLEPDSPVPQHLRGRMPWLFVNTITASFAAWVVSNYEASISEVAALAVFQSMIAGQGGNAASQIVAMIIRSLALGKLDNRALWKILARQTLVGLMQGAIVGLVIGAGAYVWKGNAYLGLVVGLSLLCNMILAGFIGTLTPVVLNAIGQDPALASSVLVTAVTDSGGFFIFFTLASVMLQYLK